LRQRRCGGPRECDSRKTRRAAVVFDPTVVSDAMVVRSGNMAVCNDAPLLCSDDRVAC
jgi:hypothetical protein